MLPNIDAIGLILHTLPIRCYTLLLAAATMEFRYRRRSCIAVLLLWFVVSSAWSLSGYLLFPSAPGGVFAPSDANPLALVLFDAFVVYLINKDRLYQTLFSFFTQVILYFGYMFLSFTLSILWFDANVWADFILRTVLYGLTLWFYLKYVRKPYRVIVNRLKEGWGLIALAPFCFCAALYFLILSPRMFYERESVNYLVILVVLTCACVFYAVLYQTFKSMMRSEEEKNKRELLSVQNKLWQEQLRLQENALETARRFRHDSRHHALQTIYMLREGSVESAIRYQSNLCEIMESSKLLRFCENPSVNGVLSVYAQRAAQKGIEVSINATIPNGLAIADVELCGLMANAMENALEGCMRLPGDAPKFIRLHVFVRDGQMRLRLVNSCLPRIAFLDEMPVSEKKSGGIGTKSIAFVAQRYQGLADFQAADGVFKLYVILNVEN